MGVNNSILFGDFGNVPGHFTATDAAVLAETLQPRPIDRPDPVDTKPCDIRVPRSARRSYSHDEQCLATAMMAKLRARSDQRPLADHARSHDADHALDAAVDRLLDVL